MTPQRTPRAARRATTAGEREPLPALDADPDHVRRVTALPRDELLADLLALRAGLGRPADPALLAAGTDDELRRALRVLQRLSQPP